MNKKYKVEGLDCANCAAKIENKIKNIDGIEDVNLSYLTEKLKLKIKDGEDISALEEKIVYEGNKIEPNFKLK